MSQSQSARPQPHVNIPHGARPLPPPPAYPAWTPNIYDYDDNAPSSATPTWQPPNAYLSTSSSLSYGQQYPISSRRNGSTSSGGANLSRPASFAATTTHHDPDEPVFRFPEPQLHRSISQQSSNYRPNPLQNHRYARSDAGPVAYGPMDSVLSFQSGEFTPEESMDDLSNQLSCMTLESEEGLRRFQAGQLAPQDEEWHRLVPETARDALGKKEVERQSVLFEVFKSEREYVADLEAFREVFIDRLASAGVMASEKLEDFSREAFWNLDEIISYHQSMLGSLFARQRDQHPLIQSVSDIILETVLNFRPAYESYIKHYPISESRHRTELKNPRYQKFVQECMNDRRIRKRDPVTFLSRPVTRLPRLILVLEHIEKLTEADHPDLETMPLILTILRDFIKSTQPGIESAENKVKLLSLCQSLVYRKGEIIDMDLYDESRQLVYMGPLARLRTSAVETHSWTDYVVALLDNYLIIAQPDKRTSSNLKNNLVSRPIPLEFLRLGQFDQPPVSRKERADDGGLLESLRSQYRSMYPFTIYHAADKMDRRYTLYSTSEAGRKKWYTCLVEAMQVRRIRQEVNQWFVPNTLNDGFFRARPEAATTNEVFTGRIATTTPFVSGGRNFLAVGSSSGVYVGIRGSSNFLRVLNLPFPTSVVALQDFNKLLVQVGGDLHSYSLDIMARLSQSQSSSQALEASHEKAASDVLFFRTGELSRRTLVIYATKSFRQTVGNTMEVVRKPSAFPRDAGAPLSFRPYGNTFYVPGTAHDITFMKKTVAVASDKGITVIDPTNLSAVTLVPDFGGLFTSDQRLSSLKARCDRHKPLGLARSDHDEILVIYSEFGCYVSPLGEPRRDCNFIRWETKVTTFAHRGANVLLFSSDFIEIRNIATGRLVEVKEGRDVRLLHSGPPARVTILVAMRGKEGSADVVQELLETAEIGMGTSTPSSASATEGIWDEWDMA